MRQALLLAAVLLLALGAWWLTRPGVRAERVLPAGHASAGEPSRTQELHEPELFATEASEAPEGEPGERESESASSTRRAEVRGKRSADRAVLRGRLLVAETRDPIEAVLSVRLRTVDLVLKESVTTRPDGSFTSTLAFPRSAVLAAVKDDEGRELVDHEAAFDPLSPDEWLVPVPSAMWPTSAVGRVVDRRGDPCVEARVQLVPVSPDAPYAEELSYEEGLFRLEGLRAGTYRLHVQGRWSRSAPLELTLRSGPNELGDLLLAEPPPAGDLHVRLLHDDRSVWPTAMFELRALDQDFVLRFDSVHAASERGEDGTLRLTVEGLPAGRYTLGVRSLDGLAYEPASASLSPPATVEFRAHGLARAGYRFRARSSATGEELTTFSVFGRLDRLWELVEARPRRTPLGGRAREIAADEASRARALVPEVRLRAGFDAWVAWAPGHRAATGVFADSDDGQTIVVELEPGWSELFQFEDAEGDSFSHPGFDRFQSPPVLEGVEVHADGELAGRSGADGVVVLHGASEPERIEFRLAGWRPVVEYRFGILRTIAMAQSP